MAMPAWMPEAWAQLNEEDQKSVSDFMSFLLNRKKPAQEEATSLKPVNYGVFKGRIKVPENFDDPVYCEEGGYRYESEAEDTVCTAYGDN